MSQSFFIKSALLFVLTVLVACSSDDGNNPASSGLSSTIDPQREDFILVHAKEISSFVGSSEKNAKANERPLMQVKFTYDFSIGNHEVTCGEYSKIMKSYFKNQYSDFECVEDSLPVAEVSYYDAILFANARSKKEKNDTVYTYSSTSFDNEGHCTHLENLTFHPEVKGYRLPTEAEWTLVAEQGWDLKESWTASNSDYKAHKVCSKKPNHIGACDMAGNLMEWVNDWMGNFKDTTLSNFVGAPDGGTLGERVVKGGSFRNDDHAINTFSRGDIYTVTSSTRANYVGFRLAFGPITEPTWLSHNGSVSNNRIIPTASANTIHKLLGTTRAKLAFRNDQSDHLAIIDYTSGSLTVREFQDSVSVFHPEISPDGNKVAFSTNAEGNPGKSSLYVRDIKKENGVLVKLDVESAAIPRWRILPNGDTVITYVTSAGNNKNEDDFNAASTWQVSFSGNKFGKPQKLFDGAYHGGISSDNQLAVTGARLLRARKAIDGDIYQTTAKDTIWYEQEQACNASLSKDNSKRTLFLDFGGKTGQAFTGNSYRTHEMLLIADSTGKLVQAIPSPTGFTFDHSEWVAEDLAVATLTSINGVHEKIVLINTNDSTITTLASGDELWHPSLWFEKNKAIETSLDLDSAGQYYNTSCRESALYFRNKLEILWNNLDAKVAVVGSSRSLNSVNPMLMDNAFNTINLSNVPNSIYESDFLLQNYVLKHLNELKYAVVSLDIDMWWKMDNSEYNFFHSDYRNCPGYAYDESHHFWEDGYPEGLAEATHNSYNDNFFAETFIPTKGHLYIAEGSWDDHPTTDYDSTWFDQIPEIYYQNFLRLEHMISAAAEFDVTVIGVIFPMNPNYQKTGSFGRYGIRRSVAPKLLQEIANLSTKYDNFIFMDENKMGKHDYTSKMAANNDHLSATGAIQFTHRLDSLIKSRP